MILIGRSIVIFQMGNTVSAAEAVAAGITHTINKPELVPDHSKFDLKSGTPPPECPMHQKVATPAPSASECPVINKDNDINPYNMVCHTYFFIYLMSFKYAYFD